VATTRACKAYTRTVSDLFAKLAPLPKLDGMLLLKWLNENSLPTSFIQKIISESRKEKKDNSDVLTGVNYGVASFSSWSKSICNPKIGGTRIRGSPKTIASFRR
jgi:hypothetical protein